MGERAYGRGAEDVLLLAQKDISRYIVRDEGLLLSRSRKALICLSQNEVNTIVQRSLRSDDISTSQMLSALSEYIKWVSLHVYIVRMHTHILNRNPETSFLALRHLRRTIQLTSNSAFPMGIYSVLMSRIASLMFAMPHLLEWECLDDIIREAMFSLCAYANDNGHRNQVNMHRWGRLLMEVFR